MTAGDRPGERRGGLFAGTAWHYARYRPGYPPAFIADVIHRFGLKGAGRLLDLGCGTGQLTVPLAAHVAEAVGVDPEPEMLAEAAQHAGDQAISNVRWVQGSSADLPGGLGYFRVVTMGRSFHWMDREHLLTALDEMVDDDGGVVIANDSCLVGPTTPWQQAIEEVQRRFLPADHPGTAAPSGTYQTHEELLATSAFRRVNRQVYEFLRPWSLEQVIGYLYSTSLPLARLLGDRRPEFERAVTSTLLGLDPTGQFTEPVALEVLTATKN